MVNSMLCQPVAVLPLQPVSACSAAAQVVSSTDPKTCKAEMWTIPLKFVNIAHTHGRELDVVSKEVFQCLLD